MAKIFDYALLACAVVAGAFLFAFGARKIYIHARSPRMTRFLIYVSIVLVFLGGKFGAFRTSSAEQGAPKTIEEQLGRTVQYPQDAAPQWKSLKALWTHIHELKAQDMTKEKFAAEAKAADGVLEGLDAMVDQGLLKADTCAFLKSEVKEELQKLNPETAGKEIPRADVIKNAWEQIKEDISASTPGVKTDTSAWVLKLLYEDTAEQFTRLKDIPLAERIAALGIKRDEYKAGVATLTTNTVALYRRVSQYEASFLEQAPIAPVPKPPGPQPAYGVVPQPAPPREQLKYGVIPRPDPPIPARWLPSPEFAELRKIFEADTHTIVAEVSEGVTIKKVDHNDWMPLKKGDVVSLVDIIEHEKEGDAKIVLEDTRFVALKGDFICTSWEYKFQITEALAKEIDELIAKLGDKDVKVRDAAALLLKKIGYLAVPKLKEALNSPDAEIRVRAQEIINASETPAPPDAQPDENKVPETPPPQK